jgi:hypothetical protein
MQPWCKCSECDWITCRPCVPTANSALRKHNKASPKCCLSSLSIYDVTFNCNEAEVFVLIKGI